MLSTYFYKVTAEDTEHLVLGHSELCSLKHFCGELSFFLPYRRK